MFREEYDHDLGDKCKKINLNEDNIKILELELARINSKLDQNNFELNDVKNNYLNQVKIVSEIFYAENFYILHFTYFIIDGHTQTDDPTEGSNDKRTEDKL